MKKDSDATATVAEATVDKATTPTIEETATTTEEKKPSLIESVGSDLDDEDEEYEHEPFFEHVNKVPFIAMCDILHSLSAAFMPGKDDKPNDRFLGAWNACLAIACWGSDKFWEAYDLDEPCPTCGGDMSDPDEDDDELPEPVKDVGNKKLTN